MNRHYANCSPCELEEYKDLCHRYVLAETLKEDFYSRLYPVQTLRSNLTAAKLRKYEEFIKSPAIELSPKALKELPAVVRGNMESLNWDNIEGDFIVLVFVLARYLRQVVYENAQNVQSHAGIDLKDFFVRVWGSYRMVTQKYRLDQVKWKIFRLLWCDAFFNVSQAVPNSLLSMIHAGQAGCISQEVLECYCKLFRQNTYLLDELGLIHKPDLECLTVFHTTWQLHPNSVNVLKQLNSKIVSHNHVFEAAVAGGGTYRYANLTNGEQNPYLVSTVMSTDPATIQKAMIRMPSQKTHASGSRATMNSSASAPAEEHPPRVAGKRKKNQRSEDFEKVDWNMITEQQNFTLLINDFQEASTQCYGDDDLLRLLMPYSNQIPDIRDLANYIKLIISERGNSSNLVIFNNFAYPSCDKTPCYVFNCSNSKVNNPCSFTCAKCNWSIQIYLNGLEFKIGHTQPPVAHKEGCVKDIDEVLSHDMANLASEQMKLMDPSTETRRMNELAYKEFEKLLQNTEEFLRTCSISKPGNDFSYSGDTDDNYHQTIRRNSRNLKDPTKGNRCFSSNAPQPTQFRKTLETLAGNKRQQPHHPYSLP